MQPPSPSHPQPPHPLPQVHPPHVIENYTAPEFNHETEAGPVNAAPQFAAPESQAAQTHHPNYEFIMNPATAVRASSPLGNASSSLIKRVMIVVAGIFVLLIIFAVAKSLLGSSGSNAASLLSVAQEQQELIHLAKNAGAQPGIAIATLNSTATITASVTSAQQQLLTYMKDVGQKIKPAQLGLKISSANDAQLAAAATAGTYDQTYQSVMQPVLNSYKQALKQAFAQTTGPKGRALLSTDYTGATLLLQQLSPSSP